MRAVASVHRCNSSKLLGVDERLTDTYTAWSSFIFLHYSSKA